MRKVLFVFSALLILSLGASIVSAQIPNVQVFFTSDWGTYGATHLDQCPPDPPGTVLDSVYVVASNFNMWISAIEYKVNWPMPHFIILGEETGGLDIGNTSTGISTAWPFPINGYSPVAVCKVRFLYGCQLCLEGTDVPVTVVPHPISGLIQAIRWPDNAIFTGVGMESRICPTIPTEDTTWGNIKALYN
jgi:hypothetical protein